MKEGLDEIVERLEPGVGEGRRGERVRGVAYCELEAERDVEVDVKWDGDCIWLVVGERGFDVSIGILK